MTEVAKVGSPPPSRPRLGSSERPGVIDGGGDAREVADRADVLAYARGELSLGQLNAQAESRHAGEVRVRGSIDPVGVYDAMHDAGNVLSGGYVWLADHAADQAERERWIEAQRAVGRERGAVDVRDMDAQRAAMVRFIARDRALSAAITL